jgi:beta-galactosidase
LPLLGSETASTVSSRGVYHLPAVETRVAADNPLWPDYQSSSYDLLYPAWASTPDTEFEAQHDFPFVAGEFVWTGFDYLGEPTPYNNDTPARSSYFGIVDLVGMKKDRFYLYQSLWSDTPVLHLLPHWNWEGKEGEKIPVHCYTNYERVELFLNGESLGAKSKNPANKAQRFRIVWDEAIYRPGELKAVAYDAAGRKQAEKIVRTAGDPAKVVAVADRGVISADGRDLSYVEITVVDADGNVCPRSDLGLEFGVEGAGVLEAVCNGDPTSHLSFKGDRMPAFSGKCMAIVKSAGKPGKITLSVKPEGLKEIKTEIITK